jgi:hypothetical protein
MVCGEIMAKIGSKTRRAGKPDYFGAAVANSIGYLEDARGYLPRRAPERKKITLMIANLLRKHQRAEQRLREE